MKEVEVMEIVMAEGMELVEVEVEWRRWLRDCWLPELRKKKTPSGGDPR